MQKVLDEAGRIATDYVARAQMKADKDLFDKFGTNDPNKPGIFVQTAEQNAELMEATKVVYEELTPVFGKELVRRALKFREKYAK